MNVHSFLFCALLCGCSCDSAKTESCGGDGDCPAGYACVDGTCAPADAGPGDAGPDECPVEALEGIPITETVSVPGLSAPVDVVRDVHGMPHLYAETLEDATRAQGFVVARDRMAQMDLFRRTASGDLAELIGVFAPDTIDDDILMRVVGLRRQAAAQWAATPAGSDLETLLGAFSDGVNAYVARIASREETPPDAVSLLVSRHTREWDPVDSLVIGRLQQWDLSWDPGDADYGAKFDTVRTTFDAGAADPEDARRDGLEIDLFDFRPSEATFTLPGFPLGGAAARGPSLDRPRVAQDLVDRARRLAETAPHVFGRRPDAGSNDWIVSGDHTASGAAMLANDPHLTLYSPSIFYLVHLDSKRCGDGFSTAGVSFPGIPGIILGFNEHVAWGATTTGFDVTDTYAETIVDGDSVLYDGAPVPIDTIEEVVSDGATDHTVDIEVVPHHGPIVPDIVDGDILPRTGDQALSWRWVGFEAERGEDASLHELETFRLLAQAGSVDDAMDALSNYATGTQNWVFADDAGAIGYTTHGLVPQRDARAMTFDPRTSPDGLAPCFALPGTGEAEWTGWLEEDRIPSARDPEAGFLVTANADPVGVTADGNPFDADRYVGWDFDPGHRAARITSLLREKIDAGAALTPEDMARIQADHRSPLGARITPFFLAAVARAEEEAAAPGSNPDLTDVVSTLGGDLARVQAARDRLAAWTFDADDGLEEETSPEDVADGIATTIFDSALVALRSATFGDEEARAGVALANVKTLLVMLEAPETLAARDADTGESVLWDDLSTDGVHESRDAILVASLAAGLDAAEAALGPDESAWLWGRVHTLALTALVPGFEAPSVDDPVYADGYPRHGDQYVVDAANPGLDDYDFGYVSGPVQRFVVDMKPGAVEAWNVIPGGDVGDPESPFFTNELDLWRVNQNHRVPFTPAEVAAAADSRIRLVP